MTKHKQLYYTLLEVAELLKVTRDSLYKWIYSGRLPASNATGHWRIAYKDLQRFMQSGMNTTNKAKVVKMNIIENKRGGDD